MKYLFDTSTLVAAAVESHSKHSSSLSRLKEVQRNGEVFVSNHTLLELFSVLTSLPLSPRMAPGTARRIIQNNIVDQSTIVQYEQEDYPRILEIAVDEGITGGAIYDLLIAFAAIKESLDRIITLNIDDFERCLSSFEIDPSHP